ncbi:transcriptional repressor [Flavobacterium sp. CBA20B-1]|uniref:Fur family transcriptional regulator n=1 Tax=unclassified Flavobacterium TaxID=196869 RepID=UPI002223F28D|nr:MULTISPECIES: transcriptional repressor [unclassified Flavobacterium]WCM40916.1 transcriptional repressor [Flavobacterium sp. CBA20B-1]
MKKSRNTIAKTKILELITDSKKALAHSEIHQMLEDFCDRVTIYRVLDRLIEEGLIHKVVTIYGMIKYAACHGCSSSKHHHNHIHFSCEECHSVTCIDDVEPLFNLPKEYKVYKVNFALSGICPECK